MMVRIESEAVYQAALKRIEEIWEIAEPGNPEGEEFDRQATLLDQYEDLHFPMKSERAPVNQPSEAAA